MESVHGAARFETDSRRTYRREEMKALADLLRDADPLRDEPSWSAPVRLAARQAIMDTPPVEDNVPRHRRAMVAVIVLMVIGVAAGIFQWPSGVADAAAV